MFEFSEDRTRAIADDAAFALVGYVGEMEGSEFVGRHAGCFKTAETAQAWLRGEGKPDFRMPYSV
jgi:hypothetical protein